MALASVPASCGGVAERGGELGARSRCAVEKMKLGHCAKSDRVSGPVSLFMGEEEIVGSGFIAPINSCDRCGNFGNRCPRCAARCGAVRNRSS